jgi:hypothetical protein
MVAIMMLLVAIRLIRSTGRLYDRWGDTLQMLAALSCRSDKHDEQLKELERKVG